MIILKTGKEIKYSDFRNANNLSKDFIKDLSSKYPIDIGTIKVYRVNQIVLENNDIVRNYIFLLSDKSKRFWLLTKDDNGNFISTLNLVDTNDYQIIVER